MKLVIQVYAPPPPPLPMEIDRFYELRSETLSKENEYYNFIMGDFIVKVGKEFNSHRQYANSIPQ